MIRIAPTCVNVWVVGGGLRSAGRLRDALWSGGPGRWIRDAGGKYQYADWTSDNRRRLLGPEPCPYRTGHARFPAGLALRPSDRTGQSGPRPVHDRAGHNLLRQDPRGPGGRGRRYRDTCGDALRPHPVRPGGRQARNGGKAADALGSGGREAGGAGAAIRARSHVRPHVLLHPGSAPDPGTDPRGRDRRVAVRRFSPDQLGPGTAGRRRLVGSRSP